MELQTPQRIVIWGTVASGKTTLTIQLSSILQISNTIHTDDIFYDQKHTDEEIEFLVSQIDNQLRSSSWIIDGNLDERISRKQIAEKADQIIILYYPIGLLLKRMILQDGKLILSPFKSANGESIRQFISYKIQLLQWFFRSLSIIKNFNRNYIYQIRSIINKSDIGHKTFIISSRKNLEEILTLAS